MKGYYINLELSIINVISWSVIYAISNFALKDKI